MELFFQFWPNSLLIFCRITAFFAVVPVFSSRNVPNIFKIGLSVFVTLIIFAGFGMNDPVPIDATYVLLIIREILVGVLLGFIAYLFFSVVQIAGSFMDIQIGFGIANVIDPMTGESAPILGNLKYMLAMLLFLSFDGHHYLLRAIMDSYRWIPISNELFTRIYNGDISEFLLHSFVTMFSLAFQLAAPIVAAMFLTDIGLGLLTRVAPQFNIFVIGAPLKMILGFILLILLFPEFVDLFRDLFQVILNSMQQLLQLITSSQTAPQ